jgi:glycerophosphoryl diester phosphodiesterase
MTAIFAHRGCHGVPAPRENTISAFTEARRLGADGVELDVRATADGALAIHHDRRVPGVGDVTNIAAAELPDDVPLLEDVLRVSAGLRVNVEIKGGPDEAVLVAALLVSRGTEHGSPPGGAFVSSFDRRSLAAVRDVAPGVPTGLLIDARTDPRLGLDQAIGLGCRTFHPFVSQVDAGLVDAARGSGVGLHVWTVNSDGDIAAMGTLGVEAIITDRVVAAIAILRAERGPGAGRATGPVERNGGGQSG